MTARSEPSIRFHRHLALATFLSASLLVLPTTSVGQAPGTYSSADWAQIIDARWGPGDSDSRKLQLFDTWWNEINLKFGGFHGIDLDIAAMKAEYRPEIQAGVSAGRFSGIMNHFTFRLQEMHTYIWDNRIRNTPLTPGTPIMVVGHYGDNRRFGANLSVLPDSSLLVYETVNSHPLGLVPGDRVLGYDGVAWKDLYPVLLEAEMPLLLNPIHANTDEANYHYLMQSAGLNWHLFDTIDVVRHASGDTLHAPTSDLVGLTETIWGKDHIAPSGVPWPDRSAGDRVGHGVIDGTNVGLVTVTSWTFDAQFDIRGRFERAVDELMHVQEVDGLIFDFRFNTGGGALAREGLQLLFNEVTPTVGFDRRVVGGDHRQMEPDPNRREANLTIQPDPGTFFDGPIAILIGPGSISAGELEARRMSFHPNARIFGLPAAAGNTGSDFISIGDSNFFVSRANSAQYLAATHEYLTHSPLLPNEEVWFEVEDVANGVDTVIKAALGWIDAETTGNDVFERPTTVGATGPYPNPSSGFIRIPVESSGAGVHTLAIVDQLGRRVAEVSQHTAQAGRIEMVWDGTRTGGGAASPGVYLWRVESGGWSDAGTLVLIR